MRAKFFSNIIEGIKFKLGRRKNKKREFPLLSWDDLDGQDKEEALEQVHEQAEEEIERLNEAMRGKN